MSDALHEPSTADIARATRGDPDAVRALLEAYLARLRAFVRLRVDAELRGYESASDVVQSVCREVLEGEAAFEYRGEPQFRAWLFTAAVNKIRKRQRHVLAQRRDRRRHDDAALGELYGSLASPSRVAMAREQVERVERAFDELSDEHREVLTLSRVAGLPARTIADHLGKSEGAVRMLLSRALVQLSKVLDRGE